MPAYTLKKNTLRERVTISILKQFEILSPYTVTLLLGLILFLVIPSRYFPEELETNLKTTQNCPDVFACIRLMAYYLPFVLLNCYCKVIHLIVV